MPKIIGYARLSTEEQELNLQIDQLRANGCDLLFTDKVSGSKSDRPELEECLKTLEKGDTLIVWRLDRLGRSMKHLITIVSSLKERGIAFKSLTDVVVDTTTASGELVFNIFAALAQFESGLIRERTLAGLAAARARGRKGSRKPVLPDDPKVHMAKTMHKDKSISINEICSSLKISRATFYRYLAL